MLRDVRGSGTLVAEDIRIIAASTAGRVERVLVQPGTEVGPGTVLLELSNSELKQSAVDAEYQVKAAEAEQKNLKVKLESERMTQQSVTATVKAEYQQARLQLDADEALAKKGVLPALSVKLSQVRTQDLANRYEIEQKRLDVVTRSADAQVAAQQARVSQLRALLNLKNEQVNNLRVLAGTSGVLQQMTVEEGQQVAPGTNLARVVEPAAPQSRIEDCRDSGQGRSHRAARTDRHAKRNHPRTRLANGSGSATRHLHCRCRIGWRASSRRASGFNR